MHNHPPHAPETSGSFDWLTPRLLEPELNRYRWIASKLDVACIDYALVFEGSPVHVTVEEQDVDSGRLTVPNMRRDMDFTPPALCRPRSVLAHDCVGGKLNFRRFVRRAFIFQRLGNRR